MKDRIGQLAKYMNEFKLPVWGIYTIHGYTWFIKRAEKYHLVASQLISLTTSSDADNISVRGAFFAYDGASSQRWRLILPGRLWGRPRKLV